MLSRRLLRAIVMQALYAFFQSGNDRVDIAEKTILDRIDKIKSLFMHQISFLTELVRTGREKAEEGKQKLKPTKEDLNPNTRFMDSQIVRQIETNVQLAEAKKHYRINWGNDIELIRTTYNNLRKSRDYEQYLQTENNYENDRDFLLKVFKKYIYQNTTLKSLYEDRNIYWTDDFDFVNNEIIKVLKVFDEGKKEDFQLFKEKDNREEDNVFVLELFRKTILRRGEYEKMITSVTQNWEAERVASIDMLLMQMALCELLNFEDIPVKVTLNEYIEIAKLYSTPKSSTFINGVLDKLLFSLKQENKLVKTGRGIIEN